MSTSQPVSRQVGAPYTKLIRRSRTEADFEVGQVVGDYEVIGKLGRGGMGAVYKARNVISHRVDALKVLLPDIESAAPDASERFLREIRVLASLRHPNIAQLLTAFRVGQRLLMVMELVEGAGLDEILKAGPMEVGEAATCAAQVLRALGHAHAQGIVHRDVKPANVVVLPSGDVKLLDFGIAQPASGRRLTLTGLVVGSISYMSPEQVMAAPADHRSDLYSVGVTLYQAVTGETPFRGSDFELMRAHVSEPPRDPILANSAIPTAVSQAILRALEKRPENRFQSADEFRLAIEPYARENATGLATLSRRAAARAGAVERSAAGALPAQGVQADSLEAIAARLASFVGPIAGRLVATASRRAATVSDMCRLLAEEIEDRKDRAAFLAACASVGQTAQSTAASVAVATTSAAGAPPREETMKRVAAELARYVGPVATVLVQRAIKRAQTSEQLYDILSLEISSDEDRRKFLSGRR